MPGCRSVSWTAAVTFLRENAVCRRRRSASMNMQEQGLFLIESFRNSPCFGIRASAQSALRFILFSNSTGISTCAFSILAFAHSTRRSAATPRYIPVSQNEKFASYLVPFSFENSIICRMLRYRRSGRFPHTLPDPCSPAGQHRRPIRPPHRRRPATWRASRWCS